MVDGEAASREGEATRARESVPATPGHRAVTLLELTAGTEEPVRIATGRGGQCRGRGVRRVLMRGTERSRRALLRGWCDLAALRTLCPIGTWLTSSRSRVASPPLWSTPRYSAISLACGQERTAEPWEPRERAHADCTHGLTPYPPHAHEHLGGGVGGGGASLSSGSFQSGLLPVWPLTRLDHRVQRNIE